MMKKHNYLLILGLTLSVIGCKEDKKTDTFFQIDASKLKQTYDLNESVPLIIKDLTSESADSVVYFLNGKRMGSVKGNATFNYALTNEKYGDKIFKAEIFDNGKSSEASVKINVLPQAQPDVLKYTILNTYPHDIKAYTQGLEFYGDILIESTGNGEGISTGTRGKSSIRKVNPKTGEVIQIVELPDAVFGEGSTVLNEKLYQLTYRNNEAYRYDIHSFEKEKTFPYFQSIEGWGLTNDGTYLYMTDGSTNIYKIKPEDFSKADYFTVATNQQVIPKINELEWVEGKIYANIYGRDSICIIDPVTGRIEGVLDLQDLKNNVTQHPDLDVLNGIAYNKKTGTFFVTGKNWDKMFEINISK